MKLFYLVVIFLIYGIAGDILAQGRNGLIIEGEVDTEKGNNREASIDVYLDGQHINNFIADSDGRFRLELAYGDEYTLVFSQVGNYPQKIIADTKLPESVLEAGPDFPSYSVSVMLLAEIPGVDKAFTENPVLKIYYSKEADGFLSEVYYSGEQLKRLVDQAAYLLQQPEMESGQAGENVNGDYNELKKVYDRLILEAETEYKKEEFVAALDGYKAASEIFPEQQYPKDRISEINDLLGFLMVTEERDQALSVRLQELLTLADSQFVQENYEAAMASYQRAVTVDLDNSHAKSRLNEIEEKIKSERINNVYDETIAAADNAFDELLYADARKLYMDALKLKSDEKYPRQKIEEIDVILEELTLNTERLGKYKNLMLQGERNFEQQLYEEALQKYEQAKDLKPGDEEALQKAGELKELIAQQAQQELFDEQIKLAEEAFQEERYEDALAYYEKASGIKTSADYPILQIRQIREILKEKEQLAAEAEAEKVRLAEEEAKAEKVRAEAMEAERMFRYSHAMTQGDSLFMLKEFESARAAYEQAMQVMPDEDLPAEKIAETDAAISKQEEAQQVYNTAVSKGDAAYTRELFNEARAAYYEAQQAMPEELYPVEMLAQIDSVEETRIRLAAEAEAAEQALIAELAEEKDRQYKNAIAKGDSLINIDDYEGARNAFLLAQQVNPEESLATDKITELDELISQITATQDAYDKAIEKGDAAVRQEIFEEARIKYEQAQKLLPEEDYPAEMFAMIDSIQSERVRVAAEAEAERARLEAEDIAEQQAQQEAVAAEKEDKYEQAIKTAANLFAEDDFEGARAAYLMAQQVKPEESLPGQKIVEIDVLLLNQAKNAQQAYDDLVAKGDDAFIQELFNEAEIFYEEAQQLKPDEEYPQQMLAKIDSTVEAGTRLAAENAAERAMQEALTEAENARQIAEAEEAEQKRLTTLNAETDYHHAIESADSLFALNEYKEALAAYRRAQQVKPDESLPEMRIDEINNLINRQTAAQQVYDASIAKGDEAVSQELFDEARAAYHVARQARPEETYPEEMLTKIDSIVGNRTRAAEERNSGQELMAAGEEGIQESPSVDADADNSQALLAAEAEAEEQNLRASLEAEKEMQYNYAISRADSHFNLKEYEQSLTFYNQALEVKNDAEYPIQRISRIKNILAGLSEEQMQKAKLEQEYNNTIQQANENFESRDFHQAKSDYERALKIKPGEPLPTQRIAETNRLLQQQELDEKYNNIIMVADELLSEEEWERAKTEYNNALAVKPGEGYPQNQLVKINVLNREHEEKLLTEQQAAPRKEIRQAELDKQQLAMNESQAIYMAERKELYQEFIDLADKSFGDEQYSISRAWYTRASDIMPDIPYPKQRVEEISRIVKEKAAGRYENEFQRYVNLADSALRIGELASSRGWYNLALTIRPDASYPKEQLHKIAVQLADRLAKKSDVQVNSHLQQASEAFAIGNYSLSKFWLLKAYHLQPGNVTVIKKLEEVEEYLE